MHREKLIQKARDQFLQGVGLPKEEEFVIDDFQREAIDSVVNGADTLVVAPTGSGKTLIALEAIRVTMELGNRAVYTTPLKALSNTKYTDLKRRFEPRFKVGLLTGDRKIDGDAQVVIATTEIYRNELYKAPERYSVVVLDEVHFIADAQRGPVWEESIILTPSSTALLMLSASISNPGEIAEWIEHVRGRPCHVVIKKERPVELRFGFLHPDHGVMPLTETHGSIYEPVLKFYSSFGLDHSGMRLRRTESHPRDGRNRGHRGRGGKDYYRGKRR